MRDPANPILRPGSRPWESQFVFNPAAIVRNGSVHLLYRAQGADLQSSIGLATSTDGVHFRRRSEPVLVATEPYELPGGCEDPRVVQVGRTYYMTYTGYDGTSARLALATSRDLIHWTKHGLLFADFQTRDVVGKPWSKSGAILTTPVVDPATGRRRYVMYFGDKDIYFAWSDDLIHWTPGPVDEPVMRPLPGTYSEELLEPGPPPLITENGLILLVHNSAAHDPDGKLIYRAGQALIDPAAPTEELARLTRPFLVPETARGDQRTGEQRRLRGGARRLSRRVVHVLRPGRRRRRRPARPERGNQAWSEASCSRKRAIASHCRSGPQLTRATPSSPGGRAPKGPLGRARR